MRPLKRWRYVGAYSPEVMVCVGEARIGPIPQRFWAVAEPGRPVTESTTIRRGGVELERGGVELERGGVELEGSRVRVRAREVELDLTVAEDAGVESVHPSGRDGYVWTRKQAGVRATGHVRVGGRDYTLDCEAAIDDTAGYHERHTSWRWSTGVGRATTGERVGWNLVTGVNDSPKDSERAIWVDGEPFEPQPVTFAGDLSQITFREGGALQFEEWSAREDHTNLLVLRSSYRQPFGTFTGSFPGGLQLERGFGVMEVHDVIW